MHTYMMNFTFLILLTSCAGHGVYAPIKENQVIDTDFLRKLNFKQNWFSKAITLPKFKVGMNKMTNYLHNGLNPINENDLDPLFVSDPIPENIEILENKKEMKVARYGPKFMRFLNGIRYEPIGRLQRNDRKNFWRFG